MHLKQCSVTWKTNNTGNIFLVYRKKILNLDNSIQDILSADVTMLSIT